MNIRYKLTLEWIKASSYDNIPHNAIAIDCSGNGLTTLPEWLTMPYQHFREIDCSNNKCSILNVSVLLDV